MWSGYIKDDGQFKSNHFVPLVHTSRLKATVLPFIPQSIAVAINSSNVCTRPVYVPKPASLTGNKINPKVMATYNAKLSQYHCLASLPKYSCHCCGQLILTQKPKKFCVSDSIKFTCSHCYSHLSKSTPAPLCTQKIGPGPIPLELQTLSSTEVHLISQVHPFMTILKLPSGGQFAEKGQAINNPIPYQQVASQLLNPQMSAKRHTLLALPTFKLPSSGYSNTILFMLHFK